MSRTTAWYQTVILLWLSAVPHAMAGNSVWLTFDAPGAREVTVAGSFDPYWWTHYSMKKRADGRWQVVLDLLPGRYEFQFLVDGKWTVDLRLPTIDDSFGSRNNVLIVPVGP